MWRIQKLKNIDNFVKVDVYIPGCPINSEEFLKFKIATSKKGEV
jgi:NADH:ubiquinone oxidoreductase subunit B-like Fe-S oxidoreductase